MKLKKTIIALSVLALAGPMSLAMAKGGEPKCDDEKQVCRDQNGPNVELTRQRYGDQAAQKVQKRLDGGGQQGGGQQGGGHQGGGQQGGGHQGGGQQGGGHQGGGQQGGGQQGGGQQGGGQQGGDTFSPMAGVRCVRSAQVCYDASGASPFYTAKYFGPAASGRLK